LNSLFDEESRCLRSTLKSLNLDQSVNLLQIRIIQSLVITTLPRSRARDPNYQ
jgi:hypothetical protein